MVSDLDLVTRLREILRSSDLQTATPASVRRQLAADFDVDLTDKKRFITDQIDAFLQSNGGVESPKAEEEDINADEMTQPKAEAEGGDVEEEDDGDGSESNEEKEERPVKAKKRAGGFTKVCQLSPQLEKFLGESQLARTEVVKKMWAYIREKDLQDPKDRRKILCDESLHLLFRVKSINMFQMNKALAKHIWPLGDGDGRVNSVKEEEEEEEEEEDEDEGDGSGEREKNEQVEEDDEEGSGGEVRSLRKRKRKKPAKSVEKPKRKGGGGGFTKVCSLSPKLQAFAGVVELARTEVVKMLWRYIKENNLQDPDDRRTIICDESLRSLFAVDSINMFQMSKQLSKHIWPSSTKIISLIVSVTFSFSLLLQSSSAQTVVKASYWLSGSEFPVTDIDSSLFTHLFCAFADLDYQTNQVTVSSANQAKFSTFTQTVQRRNPSVKTLLSIGGGDANKTAFASMASNPSSRKSFSDSSISLARSYGFHGLDLDWETPKNSAEMSDFGTLLQEWRSAVEAESTSSGKPRLLLTAAVCYSSNCDSVLYPVQAVSNSLDWVNLMAYDFYGPGWSRVTGPPAALYDPSNAGRSGDSGVKEWTEAGLPTKKAVLGFPYNGWSWTLANANSNGYGAATNGPAISKDGSIRYIQLKSWIVENKATTVHDDQMVGDYSYAGTTWIGYDSEKSIVTKVRYAKQKGLLGYFSWHVGNDDGSELSRAASQAWDT